MSVETRTSSVETAFRAETSSQRPPLTTREVSQRLAGLAAVAAEAAGSHFAEITVTSEAGGGAVGGHWPQTLPSAPDSRCAVVIADGRRVTIRLARTAEPDGSLVNVCAWAAAALARSADDGRGGAVGLGGLVGVLASMVGRPVVVQDATGGESRCADAMTGAGGGATVRRLAVFDAGETCRTWPVRWQGGQVGRLWIGPGRALTHAELTVLRGARSLLGALLSG